jgi:degV domain-containing protein CPE0026
MSKFFCDSNCELWFDKVESLGINYISMPYTVGDNEYYYDLGKNTDNRKFFEDMRKGAVPKTSALNMQNYIDYFEPVLKQGEDIIYVTFSHKMSATFESMAKAIEQLKQTYPERTVSVVDTKHISMAAGIVVYYAAKLHNEGASDEEVVKFVESFRERVKCYFTVSNLIYLKRGGRLSSFKAFVGTLFDIKPIISNIDGKLENIEKSKGRKKSLKDLTGYLEKDKVDLSYPIVIMNADCDPDADYTVSAIREKYPDAEIWEQLVGPVIGSHCGPDTIGVIFVAAE